MAHNINVLARFILFILTIALHTYAFAEMKSIPEATLNELKKEATFLKAAQAMENKLPEIAVFQLRNLLQQQSENKTLSDESHVYLSLILAESLIRQHQIALNNDDLINQALALLDKDTVRQLDDAAILKAQASTSLGRYNDASKALSTVNYDSPLYKDSLLIRARIYMSMLRYDEALSLLKEVQQSAPSQSRNSAYLLSAEILFRQNKTNLAKQALGNVSAKDPKHQALKTYLLANITLASGKTNEALELYQTLTKQPSHLTEELYQACFLGIADAQAKNNDSELALNTLSDFIEKNPESSQLSQAFYRLGQLLAVNTSEENPALIKLRQWSNTSPLGKVDFIDLSNPYLNKTSAVKNDLQPLATYHLAMLLANSGDIQKQSQALALFNQLRTSHFPRKKAPSEAFLKLISSSLIETAYIYHQQKKTALATYNLSLIKRLATSQILKEKTNIIYGLLLAEDQKIAEATNEFLQARSSSNEAIANIADLNASISALKANDLASFNDLFENISDESVRASLQLERALWKCSKRDITGREELEVFINQNQGHPREAEARLALADACINITPRDTLLAKSQLDIIKPNLTSVDDQYQATLIRIQAEALSQNWVASSESIASFIKKFPEDPRKPNLILRQGTAYFHNKDYNQARITFQEIVTNHPDSKIATYAQFYTALSARLVGTKQAREESIDLFQQVIDANTDLSVNARIQQGRALIDSRKYAQAEKSLKLLFDDSSQSHSTMYDAGILLADCYYRQGLTDQKKYGHAVSVYKKILTLEHLPIGKYNRIKFLLGQAYESMNAYEDAFMTYYSAITENSPTTASDRESEEWEWFYQCSFRALKMLELEKRWEAAVNLASKNSFL